MGDDLTDHARRNRAAWDVEAERYMAPAEEAWASDVPDWGIWRIPERDLRALPDVAGMDVVELGCGTAYWSAWLARRGARPVGIDNSAAQLATARRMQAEHGPEFPLIHGTAESVPLPDASFDLAFSEYGASLWCDPYLWIPEAARLLRPGGLLVFLTCSPIFMAAVAETDDEPIGDRLRRPYFGMRSFEWPGEDGVEFNLPYGEWIAVMRAAGLEVEALHELRAPVDGDPGRFRYVTAEWARRWPHEVVWVARRA